MNFTDDLRTRQLEMEMFQELLVWTDVTYNRLINGVISYVDAYNWVEYINERMQTMNLKMLEYYYPGEFEALKNTLEAIQL